jgi:hypothetical protein
VRLGIHIDSASRVRRRRLLRLVFCHWLCLLCLSLVTIRRPDRRSHCSLPLAQALDLRKEARSTLWNRNAPRAGFCTLPHTHPHTPALVSSESIGERPVRHHAITREPEGQRHRRSVATQPTTYIVISISTSTSTSTSTSISSSGGGIGSRLVASALSTHIHEHDGSTGAVDERFDLACDVHAQGTRSNRAGLGRAGKAITTRSRSTRTGATGQELGTDVARRDGRDGIVARGFGG